MALGLGLGLQGGAGATANTTAHVIVLLGQSNILGQHSEALASGTDDPLSNMFQLSRGDVYAEYSGDEGNDGDLIPAYQPLQHSQGGATIPDGASMGFHFAKLYAQANPGVDVYLLPCGYSGSSINTEWASPSGSQITETSTRFSTLVSALSGYESIRVPTILWMQGESDIADTAYETDLAATMSTVRGIFSSYYTGTIPWVAGLTRWRQCGRVNTKLWNHQNTDSSYIVADLMDLGLINVGTDDHFTNTSQRTAGARMWSRYQELLAGSPSVDLRPTIPSWPATVSGNDRFYDFDDLTDSSGNGGADLVVTGNVEVGNGLAGFYNAEYLDTDMPFGTNYTFSALVVLRIPRKTNNGDGTESVLSMAPYYLTIFGPTGAVQWTTKAGEVCTSTTLVNDGAWHGIGVVYNRLSGVLQLYVDGTLEASLSGTTNRSTTDSAIIGGRVASTAYFGGIMAKVRLYNTALSQAVMEAATAIS